MIKFNYNLKTTPQTQPIPGQNQIHNNAGGYGYQIDEFDQFRRFLIIGVEGGTYYSTEKLLTLQNAAATLKCLNLDPKRAVELIVDVSVNGKAFKVDPAIFALALAMSTHSPLEARKLAAQNFNKVIRIGTHLFQFVEAVKTLRGWGRILKNTIQNWYKTKELNQLAYQCIKYKNRAGWTHKDVLREAHVKTDNNERNLLFKYLVGKAEADDFAQLPKIVRAHEEILTLKDKKDVEKAVELIAEFGLTHEMIPNELKGYPEVWEALLTAMPLTAMVRNLNKMTVVGLLAQRSLATQQIIARLSDQEYLKKSRIHPIFILSALKQYQAGLGLKGSLTWIPVPKITDALSEAFYLTFDNVKPVGGRGVRLALDVSGSMTMGNTASNLTAREITAAMALITASVEPDYDICMFDSQFSMLDISPKMRLDDVLRKMAGLNFGATDCSLPMQQALQTKQQFDLFVVYTDNETWFGKQHPSQALIEYRNKINPNAKLCVCATTATNISIADPKDKGMLDICGFSTDTPNIIGAFGRGEF